MFESNSKFPKFFIYMQLALSLIILIGMFFNVVFVGSAYFIALILSAVFLMLDKKYGSLITNYKLTFFLFDLINLMAVIAVIYYEYTKHVMVLNIFLILFVIIQLLMMVVDIYLIKNKNVSKNENFLANMIKLCSMICILTYFFNVSDLFFAIDAFLFEIVAFGLRLYVNRDSGSKDKKEFKPEETEESKIEKRIHSAGENEGEVE